jgi:hypothetical protein
MFVVFSPSASSSDAVEPSTVLRHQPHASSSLANNDWVKEEAREFLALDKSDGLVDSIHQGRQEGQKLKFPNQWQQLAGEGPAPTSSPHRERDGGGQEGGGKGQSKRLWREKERERQREAERETERERKRDRQTDRQTDRQADRHRQRDKKACEKQG